MAGELNWGYSLIFGAVTLVATFIGIKSVSVYIAASGRESIIALLLVIVLSIALVSIPLKHLLLN